MTTSGPKALLIEDDADSLLVLRSLCAEESLVPEIAIEGNDALRRLENEEYAVIILDLEIPGLDGINLIDHLRGARPDLLERVVLFTGLSSVDGALPELPTVPKTDTNSLRYAIRRTIGADREAN